ncbi:hypothetical protein HBO23_32145 [Pseudomonas sp. WS 5532]|uniref:hypothetical protein n=1 Tax=Pseudomonas sp. WS 5532 TaxID=2717495 RepID=UPI0014767326|nr:hypothetical protein [Pseudomonas sp. WS 5532]NMX77619.1 hypothetical protein [Pseudomonas sp. WS 5532]
MQHKMLIALSCALFVGTAQAEATTAKLNFKVEGANTTFTVVMGSPTPLQLNRQEISTTCRFTRDLAGTPVQTTYSVDGSYGTTAMVLPLERTVSGLKAYVTVNKQSSDVQKMAEINKGCQLPIGGTSTIGASSIDTYRWGVPSEFKLSDGSTVIITAEKEQL